jgi:hypothetical protein
MPNREMFALNPNKKSNEDDNGFLVGLTTSNVHTSVSTPVLLIIVVIVTVILGTALSLVVFVARKWYLKLISTANFFMHPLVKHNIY